MTVFLTTTALFLALAEGFPLLTGSTRRATLLTSEFYRNSGSDSAVNGGTGAFSSPAGRRNNNAYRRPDFVEERGFYPGGEFDPYMMDPRRFDPRQQGYGDGRMPPPPPPPRGGIDPQSAKYFGAARQNRNAAVGGRETFGPGAGSAGPSQRGQSSQRYFANDIPPPRRQEQGRPKVYDAELSRDEEYYARIERLFPVLSRLQGIDWQGDIQYFDGDLQYNKKGNSQRPAGMRYDLEANGSVFLTMTLGGRRIDMRGQRDQAVNGYGQRALPSSRGQGAFPSSLAAIRLDPMNEQDPNYMVLTELDPDTVLINEIDRYTGKVVLSASLSLTQEGELIQVSHDVGDAEMPIIGHQIWTLARPGTRRRSPPGAVGTGASRRRTVTSGSDQAKDGTAGSIPAGSMGRVYPVLRNFAGITWEGDCRQVPGDLQMERGMAPPLFGGSRFDIFEDGTVVLTTFVRTSPDGRLQSVEMTGRRINGPGSPIKLDMDRGPNSMIISEVAPNTLLMNEVNRETGRIMASSSLFLASEDEVVQVSHQVSGRNPRMPIELHQVWRMSPAPEGYEEEEEWRDRELMETRQDRERDVRGRRSAWSADDYEGRGPYGGNGPMSGRSRRSINGRLTEPIPRSPGGYGGDMDSPGDNLWLLNRSPEETRDRFREVYDRYDSRRSRRLPDRDDDPYPTADLAEEEFVEELDPRDDFPVLSQIAGIDWEGTCRYVIGDTKPDSIMLLKGGTRIDLSPDGVCTMTTTLVFDGGRAREVTMRGYRERSSKYGKKTLRLYPIKEKDEETIYIVLTEISPDTILFNEIDAETDKVIYTSSLSLSNDRQELIQVNHELGDSIRMPVEGHQVWRMQRFGAELPIYKPSKKWVPGSGSPLEEVFPVLSKVEGTGWQGTFRFINGDLERQLNFEATGKMWYDLNRNGTVVLTIVSSLTDGSSRYVQMRGDRPPGPTGQIRLDPVDPKGANYMVITELPPDTVLLSEIDRVTNKLVSTASLSVYKDELIQISHEIGNSTRMDGHQIARLKRAKDRSTSSRGTMSYLLNGDMFDTDSYYGGGDALIELFPVLNQIDGVNWQGSCQVVGPDMREQRRRTQLFGGMRYDLHRNGTCTMTSVLMNQDGKTHQIKLQGTRVGKSIKRSIRLDPVNEDSPYYTVLTEVPPDTILLNEVDKATNKVIFTASVSIANPDELIQVSHDIDARGMKEESHKIWRLKRSAVLGRNIPGSYSERDQDFQGGGARPASGSEAFQNQRTGFSNQRGRGVNYPGPPDPRGRGVSSGPFNPQAFSTGQGPYGPAAPSGYPNGGFSSSTRGQQGSGGSFNPTNLDPSNSVSDTPFGKKPRDPNLSPWLR